MVLLYLVTAPPATRQQIHLPDKQNAEEGRSGGPRRTWVSRPPTHVTAVTCDPPLQAILRDFTFLTLHGTVQLQLYGKRALQILYWRPVPGPEPPHSRSACPAGWTRVTPAQGPAPGAFRTAQAIYNSIFRPGPCPALAPPCPPQVCNYHY